MKNIWKAVRDWCRCLKAGGRCQHDMLVVGRKCRHPKGHEGSHDAYRTGIPLLDPR